MIHCSRNCGNVFENTMRRLLAVPLSAFNRCSAKNVFGCLLKKAKLHATVL
jgi:hypothetical protein